MKANNKQLNKANRKKRNRLAKEMYEIYKGLKRNDRMKELLLYP